MSNSWINNSEIEFKIDYLIKIVGISHIPFHLVCSYSNKLTRYDIGNLLKALQ